MNENEQLDDSDRDDGASSRRGSETAELEAILSRIERQAALPDDRQRLNDMLVASAACRTAYLDWMRLTAELSWHLSPAKPLSSDELLRFSLAESIVENEPPPATADSKPPAAAPRTPVLGFLGGVIDYASHSRMLMLWLIGGLLGMYFVIQVGSLLISRFWAQNATQIAEDRGAGTEKLGQANDRSAGGAASGKIVARLTDAVDCQWQVAAASGSVGLIPRNGLQSLPLGAEFHVGQKLNLAAGLAELTFDSGAKVILNAPARFDVADGMGGNLQVGKLTAKIPHSAIGFTVATPGGKVVDLGTEFGVKVNDDGKLDVIVYVGDVKVEGGAPGSAGASPDGSIHLSAGHAITIGPDHVAKPAPLADQHFVRDLSSLGDKTKAEAAYVEFMKSLKPAVWFRMESKPDERVLHDEVGGPDAKLNWDGPGNPFVHGQIGKSVWLRGRRLQDHAVVPKYPQSTDGKLSAAAWVYADSAPMYGTIVSNWGGVNGQFRFGLSWDNDWHRGLSVELMPPDGNFEKAKLHEVVPQSFTLYEWQHVAFTADGSTVRLYRQGREVASGSYSGLKYPVPSKALAIGGCLDASDQQLNEKYPNLWDGKLDEVALFNDALTPEQVKKLANYFPR